MKWQRGRNKQMVCCCPWIMDYYTSILVTQILHQEYSQFQTARKWYRLKINKWLQASLLVERWLIFIGIYLLTHILTEPVLWEINVWFGVCQLIKITLLNLWPQSTFSASLTYAAPLLLLFLFLCAPHSFSSPPTVTVHVSNWNIKLNYK